MQNFKTSLLGFFLALIMTTRAGAAAAEGPFVGLEVETIQNTLDGCERCGCRAKGVVEAGKEQAWWIAFGEVKSNAELGWEALGSSSHCGTGSFEKVGSDFRQTVGTPYVILELSTIPAIIPAGGVSLRTSLRIQTLSGFDKSGRQVYARTTQKRTLSFKTDLDTTFPLLIPDLREREAFGVHEVLLRLRARTIKTEPAASYGTISVTADMPGAEVLLDGGVVGRTSEGSPTVLRNVLVGKKEVGVRDFSGREARKDVVVEKDRTAEVALRLLDLSSSRMRSDLAPMGRNPQGYEEYWRVKDGAVVVMVSAGEFLMGSPQGQGEPPEHPQHRVYVSGFLIDKMEVTWRQFRKFAEATGAPLPPAPASGTPDDYPASNVVWAEAKAYCEWVGGRLATEAEWEKAARGTDGRNYPWGNDWDPERCNSWDGGPHRPESAGSYPGCVSPYGVLDMPGSMWEWCADLYAESSYAESSSSNPRGPGSGSLRVLRGGAWNTQPSWLRLAYRYRGDPSSRNVDHGFRCVQDAPE